MNWTRVRNPFTDAQMLEVGAKFHRPEAAMLSTIALRAWCAEHRPNGVFRGKNAGTVIERAACWNGRRGALLSAMLDAGVVRPIDDGFVVDSHRQWGEWGRDEGEGEGKVGQNAAGAENDDARTAPETPGERSRRLKRERDRRCYAKKRQCSDARSIASGAEIPAVSDAHSVASGAEIPAVSDAGPSDKERARQNSEIREQIFKNTPQSPPGGEGVGRGTKGHLSPESPRHAALPAVPAAELESQIADAHQRQRQALVSARAAELEARLAELDNSGDATATTTPERAARPTVNEPSLKASLDKLRATLAASEPDKADSALPRPADALPKAAQGEATEAPKAPEAKPAPAPVASPAPTAPEAPRPEPVPAPKAANQAPHAPADSVSPPETGPRPKTTPNAPQTPQAAATREDMAAAFERFWTAWPKKVAKADAQKAWAQLSRDRALPPVGVLVAAIEAQRRTRQWLKEGGRYIPHPATWLRRKQWTDELPQLPTDAACDRFGVPTPVACPDNEPVICRDEASMMPELAAKVARGRAIERVERAMREGEQPKAADLDMLLPHTLAAMIRRHGFDPRLASRPAPQSVREVSV